MRARVVVSEVEVFEGELRFNDVRGFDTRA